MGLAASQARFLGLTARKSNIEYEGQQVNQQRTALAEEVNALYNSLAALKLPVAPDTTEFYKSTYSFALTGEDTYGNYMIRSYLKDPNTGKYTIVADRTYNNGTEDKTESTTLTDAIISFDSNHRISYVTVGDEQATASVVREYDSEGYDAALRDYTMSKDEYNKKVQELNARTESLQQEDKILEMRLNQINTEQNELKTEMDAVKQVLKDNIEKTFNTFT